MESAFKASLIEIESEFAHFLEIENVFDDKVSFVEFISQNTDAILDCLDRDVDASDDGKYISLMFFLEQLKRDNDKLFRVANQLFWSSIIVAFLESERPMVSNSETGVSAEYFLDTSIVMGLLELSTPEMEQCAKEVCDVIKSSGGVLRVHPLTIEEMKAILQSVEANGAYEGSHIASAYQRRKLNPVKVAQIRVDLIKHIEKQGVSVFPNPQREDKRLAIFAYKGKEEVRKLAAKRSHSDVSYSDDNFREIHDLFMDDYIRDQRKSRKDREDIFFLTTNRDLKTYCATERHPGQDYMISSSKVILDLWMHNTKPSDISSCMLTETMAQCLNSHRSKVRAKVHEVAKYFKDNGEDFSPELYRDILCKLYRRAKGVISAVETHPDDPQQYMQAILEGNTNDNTYFDSYSSQITVEKEKLEKQVGSLSDETERKSQEIGSLNAQNQTLEHEKSKLESDLNIAETALTASLAESKEQKTKLEAAEHLNNLYAKRDALTEKLAQLKATIEPLEKDRNSSFSYRTPMVLMVLGVISIVMFGVLIVLDKTGVLKVESWELYITLVSIGGILVASSFALNSEERRKRLREEAYAEWDEKHPSYLQLNAQIEDTKGELDLAKREIKNSTAQQ